MTIDKHRATPNISIDEYVRSRVIELGRSLDGRTAIYLDAKFWILLRKASLGADNSEASRELLQLLRSMVANETIFCPISESTFLELLKQSDGLSRLETAKLIDQLSLGVTLLTSEVRAATEVAHFIYSIQDDHRDLHPLRHLIWSKLSYVLGFVHPTSTPFDAETELAIQKAFFDHMWTIPLATMVETIGEVPSRQDLKLSDIATTLNYNNAQHVGEMRSFEQGWADELRAQPIYARTLPPMLCPRLVSEKVGSR